MVSPTTRDASGDDFWSRQPFSTNFAPFVQLRPLHLQEARDVSGGNPGNPEGERLRRDVAHDTRKGLMII